MKLALHAIGDDAVRTLPSRTESGLAPELESTNCDSEHKYDLEIETVGKFSRIDTLNIHKEK